MEAEFRTMPTSIGTVLDVKISDWRLNLLISFKYCFTKDIIKLTDPNDDSGTVSFAVGLARDPHSPEARKSDLQRTHHKRRVLPENYTSTKRKPSLRSSINTPPAWFLLLQQTTSAMDRINSCHGVLGSTSISIIILECRIARAAHV
jgi:hypothetical protein